MIIGITSKGCVVDMRPLQRLYLHKAATFGRARVFPTLRAGQQS